MLVLSRRVNEQIQIGDDITITVVRLSPTSIRIGVEAPPGTLIVREELLRDATPDREPSRPISDWAEIE